MDFAPVCWPTWSVMGSPRHAVRVCGWANARSPWVASGSRTQDRRRSKVDRDRRGNAPMRPALDSGVRLANELHAAPGSHRAFVAEGSGSDVIPVPHAKAAQRYARQEAAGTFHEEAASPLSQRRTGGRLIHHQQKRGTGVSSEATTSTSRPISIDRAASSSVVSRTSWGEESRIRIGPADSRGELTILDYRAPASFEPPRHLHHREDDVLELIEGSAVFSTPNHSFVLAP